MYESKRSDKLIKILKKLFKKDKIRYESTLKKMFEIANSDPHRYKNLSHDMKSFKRVHIDSHFVLILKVDDDKKQIKFEDLQHHDYVYKR